MRGAIDRRSCEPGVHSHRDFMIFQSLFTELYEHMMVMARPEALRCIQEWWLRCHYHPNGPWGLVIEADWEALKARAKNRQTPS